MEAMRKETNKKGTLKTPNEIKPQITHQKNPSLTIVDKLDAL
jgi:hypothetical protein